MVFFRLSAFIAIPALVTVLAAPSVTAQTISGCLRDDGEIVHVRIGDRPSKPCDGEERPIHWNQVNSGKIESARAIIDYVEITLDQARALAEDVERAIDDVSTFLDKPFSRTITVKVRDHYPFPRADTRTTTILIPSNRIRGDVSGPGNRRGPGIAHEVTHIIAGWSDRYPFLGEGLAVHVHNRFGIRPAYPNQGENIHKTTAALAKEYGSIIPLADAETVRQTSIRERGRRLAYAQEGSFATYLIDTYGLEKFKTVYTRSMTFDYVYGRSLAGIEADWKLIIEKLMNQS